MFDAVKRWFRAPDPSHDPSDDLSAAPGASNGPATAGSAATAATAAPAVSATPEAAASLDAASLDAAGSNGAAVGSRAENFDQAKKAWRRGAGVVSHKPLMLQVEVTSHCNIDCIQCARVYDPRYDRKTGHMGMLSMDTFRKLEPMLPYISLCYLWGNGEAMLHPEFLDMVETLKKHKVVVTFNTHGMFLKNGNEKRLVDAGVEGVTISIDGATPETYNKIRVGSSFDLIRENVKGLTEYKKNVGKNQPVLSSNYVVMSNNVHELAEMVRFAAETGIENVHFEALAWNNDWVYFIKVFKPLHVTGHVPMEKVTEYFEEAIAEGERLGVEISSPMIRDGKFVPKLLLEHEPEGEPTGQMPDVLLESAPGDVCAGSGKSDAAAAKASHNEKAAVAQAAGQVTSDPTYGLDPTTLANVRFSGKTPVCGEPYTTLFLTWWGEIRTCCEGEKAFGNLETDDIESIWFGAEYRRFREALRDGPPPAECVKCLMNGRQKIQFGEIEPCVKAIEGRDRRSGTETSVSGCTTEGMADHVSRRPESAAEERP